MKKISAAVTATLIAALFIVLLSSCRSDSDLGTIEGVQEFILSSETVGITIYRPDVTPYEIYVSDDFLSILQTDKYVLANYR